MADDGKVKLDWKYFESFKELLIEQKHFWPIKDNPDHYWKRGVYLHTIVHPDYGELVDYVGKVDKEKLIERQITHYRNIKGGILFCASEVLKIFDDNQHYKNKFNNNDYFPSLKRNRKDGYPDPKKSDFSKILFDKDISMELTQIFFKYANSIKVYLAVVDKTHINLAEQILITQLRPIRNLKRHKQPNKKFENIMFKGNILDETKRKELCANNDKFWKERDTNNKKSNGLG